jgi:hypothetical protein
MTLISEGWRAFRKRAPRQEGRCQDLADSSMSRVGELYPAGEAQISRIHLDDCARAFS